MRQPPVGMGSGCAGAGVKITNITMQYPVAEERASVLRVQPTVVWQWGRGFLVLDTAPLHFPTIGLQLVDLAGPCLGKSSNSQTRRHILLDIDCSLRIHSFPSRMCKDSRLSLRRSRS